MNLTYAEFTVPAKKNALKTCIDYQIRVEVSLKCASGVGQSTRADWIKFNKYCSVGGQANAVHSPTKIK